MSSAILVINPGSTSTKVALFAAGSGEIRSEVLPADPAEGTTPADQLPYRREALIAFLDHVDNLDCVAARGGMVRPIAAGTYLVNDLMIEDLMSCRYGNHASNLGAPLARAAAARFGCPAIIADPVGVDEFLTRARLSGLPGIERKSFSHALNLRAAARKAAVEIGSTFEAARFVGVHLGGGISIAAIDSGKIVDVNNSSEGGPFTPQRAGTLPVLQLVDLCFSGKFGSSEEVKHLITREGGLRSYLGTDSVEEIMKRIGGGDDEARRVMDAMVYQIAKEIGAMAAALGGRVDAVFLTGGFARKPILKWIRGYIDWIAPVLIFPGEGEMEALAEAALRYVRGAEAARTY